jgi:hypothetical protein
MSLTSLPAWIAKEGPWAASVHFFSWGLNEEEDSYGPFEVLITSRDSEDGLAHLQELRILPTGTTGLKEPSKENLLQMAPTGWIDKWIDKSSEFKSIDVGGFDELFTSAIRKRFFTGHIIALRFHPVLLTRQLMNQNAASEPMLQVTMRKPGESVTETTARLYNELAIWGETSAASVIAKLEGTTVVTIRNRLFSARQKGVLDKPGAGTRRV